MFTSQIKKEAINFWIQNISFKVWHQNLAWFQISWAPNLPFIRPPLGKCSQCRSFSHTHLLLLRFHLFLHNFSAESNNFFQEKKSQQKLEFYVVVNIMQTRWLPHICRTETSKTLTNLVTPPLSGKFKHRLVLTSFLQRSSNWKLILQLSAFDAVRKALRNPGSAPSADH